MDILKQMVVDYFNLGLYTADDLPMFVAVGWISQTDADQLIKSKTDAKQPAQPTPATN